jgi:hypothetical protein
MCAFRDGLGGDSGGLSGWLSCEGLGLVDWELARV